MSPMMEARAVKNVDEQECLRIVGAIGDGAHWETMKFLRPGITENQVTAHIMEYLYSIPGMEDVEDVIVSSGPNTWPNWRNFSDRIIQPGDIVFMDLAALTWNGYKSCYYRTYCVGKEPTDEQKEVYATALKWLYDSIGAVKAGTTTREIASKWPSAKEAYGYEEEDQAAANLWGHGLGLAQYDPPVISRIWSLDHPIEIKPGMVFALETQHGKMYRWGVRIEEMLIVHEDRIEIISNFPVQQITVVDPMPGTERTYAEAPARDRPAVPRPRPPTPAALVRRRPTLCASGARACRSPTAFVSPPTRTGTRSLRWAWRHPRAGPSPAAIRRRRGSTRCR